MLREQRKTTPEGVACPKINIHHADAQLDDSTTEHLVSILRMYREGASREKLAYMLDIGDRRLRAEVAKARRMGYPICSNSEVKGYRLGSREDALRTIAELRARSKELTLTADAMEEAVRRDEKEYQIMLDLEV